MSVHIGIIPDGNRRFCKKNGLKLKDIASYWFKNLVVKQLKECATGSYSLPHLQMVNEISLYTSSIDNLNRSDNSIELGYRLITYIVQLLNVPSKYFNKNELNQLNSYFFPFSFTLNIIGDLNRIPKEVKQQIKALKQKIYKKDAKYQIKIHLAMAYDYMKDLSNYNVNTNSDYNRDQSNIDLVFRTGKEKRLSGFFPTRTMYSELFFLDKMWPEIGLRDLDNVVKQYHSRTRRFGK